MDVHTDTNDKVAALLEINSWKSLSVRMHWNNAMLVLFMELHIISYCQRIKTLKRPCNFKSYDEPIFIISIKFRNMTD